MRAVKLKREAEFAKRNDEIRFSSQRPSDTGGDRTPSQRRYCIEFTGYQPDPKWLQAADVCFAAAKARGQRTVSMREWVAALGSMSAELGLPVERMVADMVARKPHAAATVAATATQQRFNLTTTRRRGVSAVMADDEPVAIEELLLSLADVGLFEVSCPSPTASSSQSVAFYLVVGGCRAAFSHCSFSLSHTHTLSPLSLTPLSLSLGVTQGATCQACADSLNETLDVIMGGSGRDPIMEDFAYFHRELTRIQKANAHAPPRCLPVPAAVWQSKEQVRERVLPRRVLSAPRTNHSAFVFVPSTASYVWSSFTPAPAQRLTMGPPMNDACNRRRCFWRCARRTWAATPSACRCTCSRTRCSPQAWRR